MQKLDKVVLQYLTMNTTNALLITGVWGSGKTHYYRNVLEEMISETPVFSDNSKTYIPIRISLFGLKSIEEIQAEIYLNIWPILKNRGLKLGVNIVKSLSKAIFQYKDQSYISDAIDTATAMGIDKKDLIKFEEIVLCFDDLERISSNLKLEELIGFINSLVENDCVKILIIANEEKLDPTKFKDLKEKVIGNSIEFLPSIDETFNNIITTKYSGYPLYLAFLEENKNLIIKYFESAINFRTLIFALDYFQLVYSQVKNNLFINDKLKLDEVEIFEDLLRFTLAVAIEYKNGNLTFKQRKGIDLMNPDVISLGRLLSPKESGEYIDMEELTEMDKFNDIYYSSNTYNYYKSIYDYITGGTSLEIDEVIIEINRIYHIEENSVLPQYLVFNKLSSPDSFYLNDFEYKEDTRDMLQYAYKGCYDLKDYIFAFYCAWRFNNPLGLKLANLEKRIIDGMRKGKHYKYIPRIDLHIGRIQENEIKDNIDRIRKEAIRLNEKLRIKDLKQQYSELEILFYNDFDHFKKKVLDSDSEYYSLPIFKDFSASKFYSFFLKSSNEIRHEISELFLTRYYNYHRNHNPSAERSGELDFMKLVKKRVENKSRLLAGKNVSGFQFEKFNRALEFSIGKLS